MNLHWNVPNPFTDWNPSFQCFGNYCTDEGGDGCDPTSPHAARWCALGWLKHQGVPKLLVNSFNRWCIDNHNQQPITVLNDIDKFLPRDFETMWSHFAQDLHDRPGYYF